MHSEEEKRISRRKFVKGAAAASVGAGVLAACGSTPQVVRETVEVPVEVEKIVEKTVEVPVEVTRIVEVASGAAPAEEGPAVLEVFDPFGPVEVTQLFSPRIDTLEGKTIAYVEGTWMVGTAKPYVLDLLKNQYPTLKTVDLPEYAEIAVMTDDQVAGMLKEKGLDAVIVGNAG